MTQITEKTFRKSLNMYKDTLLFQKNQVLPMAFTKTVCDYFVISENNVFLVECKEIDCRRIERSFVFSRVTQLKELIRWNDKFVRVKAYLLVMFRKRMIKDSSAFMIPIEKFVEFERNINKKSANLNDFIEAFEDYKMSTRKSYFKLGKWFY